MGREMKTGSDVSYHEQPKSCHRSYCECLQLTPSEKLLRYTCSAVVLRIIMVWQQTRALLTDCDSRRSFCYFRSKILKTWLY